MTLKPYIIDQNPRIEFLSSAFSAVKIILEQADVLNVHGVDTILCPTGPNFDLDGGFGKYILEKGGDELKRDFVRIGRQEVGHAVITKSGALAFRALLVYALSFRALSILAPSFRALSFCALSLCALSFCALSFCALSSCAFALSFLAFSFRALVSRCRFTRSRFARSRFARFVFS